MFRLLSIFFLFLSTNFLLPAAYAADCNPTIAGNCPAGLPQIEELVANLLFIIVGLGFITLLVLLVMAGIKYLTSGGEPKAISSAHQTITWALLGIVFMAIAWLILQLIHNFTGINVTVFDVKKLCSGPLGALQFCNK